MTRLLSLPMYPELTEEMIRYVVAVLREELSVAAPALEGEV
jgi:dTDP-4-amino-4,6-dideoxygalactose transaminase